MGLFTRKSKWVTPPPVARSPRDYVVVFNVAGVTYYMDWPAEDVDGEPITMHTATEWFWQWVVDESEHPGGIVQIEQGHDSVSFRASLVESAYVLDHNRWAIA